MSGVKLDVLLVPDIGEDPLTKLANTKPVTANDNVAAFKRSRKEPAEVIQRAGEDLRWYFEEREAAMGLRSCGFGASDGATGTGDDDPDGTVEEFILRVVRRERPIRRAIQALAWRDQCALEAYFDYAPRWQGLPLAGLSRLNEFACVAFLTEAAQRVLATEKGHPQELRKVLAMALEDMAEHEVTEVRLEATHLIKGACQRYLEAKLRLGVR